MRSSAIFGAGLSLACFMPGAVHAAAFRYGNAVSIGDGVVQVRYRTADQAAYFRCTLASLSCEMIGDRAPVTVVPDAIVNKRPIASPRGDLVLTREPVAQSLGTAGTPMYINTIYPLASSTVGQATVLPVTAEIRRAYFPVSGNRLVLATPSAIILYDRASNMIVNTMQFDFGNRVAFTTISPTGKYFAYYQYGTTNQGMRVHTLINLETGKAYRGPVGEREWDLLGDENRLFQFSPDEKVFVYLDDRDGFPTLYRIQLANLSSEKLGGSRMIAKKYTVADFLLWDAQTVYFVANRETPLEWNLYRYNFVTGRLERVSNQVSYGGVLERSGQYLLYDRLDAQGATVIYYDTVSRETAPVPAQVSFTSMQLQSGTIVKSGKSSVIISYPDGFSKQKTYPVIVWLHGGPYRQTSPGYHSYQSYGMYDWILENLRQSGYVIAKLDYRGSYGYGKAFADGLRGNIGLRDVSDVMSDLALVKRNVNTGQVYLMGNSYGAYVSMRTLVERGASFAGAIGINGVYDWAELNRRVPEGLFAAHFEGPPKEETQQLYFKASILGRLDGLSTSDRIMLVHSEEDTSVPYGQSVLLRDALAARGRQDVFVSYPGEDHVFAQSTTVEDLCRRVLEFVGASSAGKCELL
jgi:dipeptidyl aminopeptidase/acylaminoacyl peptidase